MANKVPPYIRSAEKVGLMLFFSCKKPPKFNEQWRNHLLWNRRQRKGEGNKVMREHWQTVITPNKTQKSISPLGSCVIKQSLVAYPVKTLHVKRYSDKKIHFQHKPNSATKKGFANVNILRSLDLIQKSLHDIKIFYNFYFRRK